jgi:2-polyprenyl-3-methyl-5-hydroxy-6-metoxy-1,4-benzoquinol methylase
MSHSRTVKELVRHSVAKTGLARLHVRIRKAMGENVDHLFEQSLSDRFAAIYRNRLWLNGRPSGALSGLGSEIANTYQIRKQLPELLKSLGTKTLLDVGCGDFNWMREIQLPGEYVGIDIVREVIETNIDQYGVVGRSFRVLDGTRQALPDADTVLCREVLFHLSFGDIWNLIENVRQSKATFFIATTDNELRMNADILSGDFRFLNLRRAPFYFPVPALSILDNGVAPDRVLAAWRAEQLPLRRNSNPTNAVCVANSLP